MSKGGASGSVAAAGEGDEIGGSESIAPLHSEFMYVLRKIQYLSLS